LVFTARKRNMALSTGTWRHFRAAALGLVTACAAAAVAVAINHALGATKESDQNYLALGAIMAPIVATCLGRKSWFTSLASGIGIAVAWYALCYVFFEFMALQSIDWSHEQCSGPGRIEEHCVSTYGFENELNLIPLGFASSLGLAISLAIDWLRSRNASNKGERPLTHM
jgi:hypothetical protein